MTTTLAEKLHKLPIIDKKSLATLGLKPNTLHKKIQREISRGKLLQLKKGTYVTQSFVDLVANTSAYTNYLEWLACNLYPESYLSTEYVLQKFNALTEAVYPFTLITRKKTYTLENTLGSFIYRNLGETLFTGFKTKTFSLPQTSETLPYQEATKSKALFDYLYLKKRDMPTVSKSSVDSLRINTDTFGSSDTKELEDYLRIAKSRKLDRIIDLLF